MTKSSSIQIDKSIILAGILPFILTSACSSDKEKAQKPNVIIVMTDDQGYGDLACLGNEWINTPNLDKLHSQSVRLTDFHVSPTSAPTRAALLTGHYSDRTGVWHTVGGRSLLREGEVTIANVFAENCYKTGIFGKWHLGDNYPFRPQDRGFDEVLIHKGGGMGQAPDYWDNDYFDDTYFHNGEAVKIDGFCTDIWFDNAMKFIEENKDDPFFCYIAPNAPHGPFNVADKYVEDYKDNQKIVNPEFYGMIANIDENMGLLMNMLEELDIADNTILIFLTDNGSAGGAQVKPNTDGFLIKGYNAGMRGTKSSMYEGGHRVPFFIRWPKAAIGGGKDVEELTAHVDLLPTLIDMLDLDFDENYKFDGQSIADLITGISTKKERKLIVDSQRIQTPEKWRRSSVMDGKWRLINGQELYNIANDPEQKNDISDDNPEIVKELVAFYENWWADLSPEFDHFPAIVIGSENEPLTIISSHDIHTEMVAWNHEQIRDGIVTNGEWVLKVAEKAKYKIALRRWPIETDGAIGSIMAKSPAIEGTSVQESHQGRALNIVSAGLKIGNYNDSVEVQPEDKEAVFTVDLEAGLTRMEAFFTKADKVQMSAYYVYINKL